MSRAVGVKKPQRGHFAKKCNAIGIVGRTSQGYPIATLDKALKCVEDESGSKAVMSGDRVVSDLVLPQIYGASLCGKRSFGFFWMHGTVCVYAQPLRNGMSQGGMGRTASSSSSFWRKSQWSSGS